MVKKSLIVVAILIVAMAAGIPGLTTYARSSDKTIPAETASRFDTLSLTQEEYLEAAREAVSRADADEHKIEAVCEAFLTLGKAYVRNPKAYDCTLLVAAESMDKNTVQYRLSEYRYLSALYEALEWTILWDDLMFTDFKASVDGDHATASVVESYRYYLNNDFNKESFRRRMLSFELHHGPDGWRITDVTTNSVHESEDGFQYVPIDVEGAIDALMTEMKEARSAPSVSDALMNAKSDARPTTLRTEYPYYWAYTAADAVDYAEEHFDEVDNPVFGFHGGKGGDCQNFASQCVWAGLGGVYSDGVDKEDFPAVSTGEVGSDAFNVWCAGQCTEHYEDYNFNWAWDNVRGFFKLMEESQTDEAGPYGNSLYSNAIAYAQVGNVLAFADGAPSADTLEHAMFVTAVTGTSGQRTKTDVMVAAHTNPTDTAYQTLAEYEDSDTVPVSYFARAVIFGGHYSEPEPQ